jgi:hypothetical protein
MVDSGCDTRDLDFYRAEGSPLRPQPQRNHSPFIPQGRNGWQLFRQMMRGCASLESWCYDFGRARQASGVIEFLEPPVPVDGEWVLATWVDRRERFSDFVMACPVSVGIRSITFCATLITAVLFPCSRSIRPTRLSSKRSSVPRSTVIERGIWRYSQRVQFWTNIRQR